MEEQTLISMVTVVSLLTAAAFGLFSVLFAVILGKKLSRADYWILVWTVYDVLTHLFMVSLIYTGTKQ